MQRPLLFTLLVVLVPTALWSQAATVRVPLRAGLTIVTALYEADKGDYESIKRFIEVGDQAARMRYSAQVRDTGDDDPFAALFGGKSAPAPSSGPAKMRAVSATRTISRADLETAGDYRWHFGEQIPDSLPGSTAVGVSRRILNELKTSGHASLRVPAGGMVGALGSLLGGIVDSQDVDEVTMMSGTLTRVEPSAVPFKVILNDDPVELMAIHARGPLGDDDAEFWILDDGDNPLALMWQLGDTRLRVIKLMYPEGEDPLPTGRPGPGASRAAAGVPPGTAAGGTGSLEPDANAASGTARRIEEDLAKDGRTVVYGIYFDFASDGIKPESEAVLAEIAKVLRQNATWNLSIEGHTDNIGGDDYNLDLSRRRAAAVKLALASRYGIDASRLETFGFGAASPKDRNDTMEGRARNRRVELVKR